MGIDRQAIEFEWKIFQGFSSLSILQEIQQDLEKKNIQPEECKDRIIFMSMINDIEWKTNDENCISNSEKIKNYAKIFTQGHWTFLGPHHVLTTYTWDALNVNASRTKLLLSNIRKCLNHVFLLEQLKNTRVGKTHLQTVMWSHDTERHAPKSVGRYCELANKYVEQLQKLSSPCLDDHHFKKEELGSVGELSEVCSQIVLKCFYLGMNWAI